MISDLQSYDLILSSLTMAAFTNNSSYEQIFDHLTGESKYQTLTAEEQTELIDILLQPKPKALK